VAAPTACDVDDVPDQCAAPDSALTACCPGLFVGACPGLEEQCNPTLRRGLALRIN